MTAPGFSLGFFASVLRYDSGVIALPLLVVSASVLIRRRVLIQCEGRRPLRRVPEVLFRGRGYPLDPGLEPALLSLRPPL
jgi:hypothetical protein